MHVLTPRDKRKKAVMRVPLHLEDVENAYEACKLRAIQQQRTGRDTRGGEEKTRQDGTEKNNKQNTMQISGKWSQSDSGGGGSQALREWRMVVVVVLCIGASGCGSGGFGACCCLVKHNSHTRFPAVASRLV